MSMTAFILVRNDRVHTDLEFMLIFSRNVTKKIELVPVLRIRIRNQNKHFGSGFRIRIWIGNKFVKKEPFNQGVIVSGWGVLRN
jgi:hypothetical protein